MPYVASTMAASVNYNEFTGGDSGARVLTRSVEIKGGAKVASKKHAMAEGVLTPQGIVTKVSDEDLEFLKKNPTFQQHEKVGAVKVLSGNVHGDKAARDMSNKDPSAPLTPADYQPGGRAGAPADMTVGMGKKIE